MRLIITVLVSLVLSLGILAPEVHDTRADSADDQYYLGQMDIITEMTSDSMGLFSEAATTWDGSAESTTNVIVQCRLWKQLNTTVHAIDAPKKFKKVQGYMESALDHLQLAGEYAETGLATGDASYFTLGTEEINLATEDIAKATDALEDLS